MTSKQEHPRITALKTQAKSLRAEYARKGEDLSHSEALERVARSLGVRNWNTLSALTRREPPEMRFHIGDRVSGHYLGHPFVGRVHHVSEPGNSDFFRITVHFDDPIDVVRFESFSALRQRVSATINRQGRSPFRITGGEPQMVITPDPVA